MSRFVSAGTTEEPSERDEAWLKAQQQIEAARQQTQKPRPGEQEGGKSLYETLQANKAAKQEAFEEQSRLGNQFRSLDDDEAEFLDAVLTSTRAKEAEVRTETRDQLEAFRRQQEDAERATRGPSGEAEPATSPETWTAGPRKRKKRADGVVGGVKVRRTSSAAKQEVGPAAPSLGEDAPKSPPRSPALPGPTNDDDDDRRAAKSASPAEASQSISSPRPSSPKPAGAGLGLAAYSSDEDD